MTNLSVSLIAYYVFVNWDVMLEKSILIVRYKHFVDEVDESYMYMNGMNNILLC